MMVFNKKSFFWGCLFSIIIVLLLSISDTTENNSIGRYQPCATDSSLFVTDTTTGITKLVHVLGIGGSNQLNKGFSDMR
jgi:hypothetical protein